MRCLSKHFGNLLPAVFWCLLRFRLRRFFSGSVHCSWVHCHLASVSLDFASLIYRLSHSLSFSLICPFHFRKHHIDSSVHALYSLSLCHSLSTSSIIFDFVPAKENQNTHERIFLDQLGYRFLFSYTASVVACRKGGVAGRSVKFFSVCNNYSQMSNVVPHVSPCGHSQIE